MRTKAFIVTVLVFLAGVACIETIRTERLATRVARLEGIAGLVSKEGFSELEHSKLRIGLLENRVAAVELILDERAVDRALHPSLKSIRDYPTSQAAR